MGKKRVDTKKTISVTCLMQMRPLSKPILQNDMTVYLGGYRCKHGFGGALKRAVPVLDRVYNPLLHWV